MFFDHRACVLVLDEQLVAPGRHRAVCGPAIWWLTPCPLLRFLWCEAAAHAVRRDPELKRFYRRKLLQKRLRATATRAFPNRSGSACGSCCGTRLITKSSVVADRSSKAVQPVRGSLKSRMARSHRPIESDIFWIPMGLYDAVPVPMMQPKR